jgi:L-threonylcarbamoyladenylate synthase
LAAVSWPVLQSSANRSGGPEARQVSEVDATVKAGVDLILDAGELPGTPSTVVDLTAYDRDGSFAVLRDGAVPRDRVEAVLRSPR